MALEFHSDHPKLIDELHSRPQFELEAPCTVAHLAVLTTSDGPGLKQRIDALCRQHDQQGPGEQRYHAVRLGNITLRWEYHTEFESIAVIRADADASETHCPTEDLPSDWLDSLQGRIVSAARLFVRSAETSTAAPEPPATQPPVVGGMLVDGTAEVTTDLKADDLGFVNFRIEFQTPTQGERTGRLVQRLIEVETYRMMALLGLPAARELGPRLDQLEARLVELSAQLGKTSDHSSEQALFDELFKIAQASEELLSSHAFRFSATAAYGRIVRDRLAELDEVAVMRRQPLGGFLYRRFEPALRTCEATRDRQESLSRRISRTANLARTRLEVTLQKQNRSLLSTMARRAQMQLRLQQTVEGLSVMAIGYYSIGILGYLLGGVLAPGPLQLSLSAAAPLVLLLIWWLLKKRRRSLGDDPADEGS